MTKHDCPGGFVTLRIYDLVLDLCEMCAKELIRVAGDVAERIALKRNMAFRLSRDEREKRYQILLQKAQRIVSGGEVQPTRIWFPPLSDEDLVRLTDDPMEPGPDGDEEPE